MLAAALAEFEIEPRGPFSLAAAQDFAGGFPPGIGGGRGRATSIAMAFPIEGTDSSAAVDLHQREDGVVVGRTDAPVVADATPFVRQAARSLSLDHDGTDWPSVGERDPVIGRLQKEHGYLRPVCFYSAYEAATSFVIGQRISMRQGARIKQWLGEEFGDRPTVDGHEFVAFPRPGAAARGRDGAGPEREEGRLAARHRARGDGRSAGHGRAARAAARARRWRRCARCRASASSPPRRCGCAAAAWSTSCPRARNRAWLRRATCTASQT